MTKEKTQESKNIYQRINTVCKEVSYVQKKDKAPKGLPYRFVSHDQVMGVLHKPMALCLKRRWRNLAKRETRLLLE